MNTDKIYVVYGGTVIAPEKWKIGDASCLNIPEHSVPPTEAEKIKDSLKKKELLSEGNTIVVSNIEKVKFFKVINGNIHSILFLKNPCVEEVKETPIEDFIEKTLEKTLENPIELKIVDLPVVILKPVLV